MPATKKLTGESAEFNSELYLKCHASRRRSICQTLNAGCNCQINAVNGLSSPSPHDKWMGQKLVFFVWFPHRPPPAIRGRVLLACNISSATLPPLKTWVQGGLTSAMELLFMSLPLEDHGSPVLVLWQQTECFSFQICENKPDNLKMRSTSSWFHSVSLALTTHHTEMWTGRTID